MFGVTSDMLLSLSCSSELEASTSLLFVALLSSVPSMSTLEFIVTVTALGCWHILSNIGSRVRVALFVPLRTVFVPSQFRHRQEESFPLHISQGACLHKRAGHSSGLFGFRIREAIPGYSF